MHLTKSNTPCRSVNLQVFNVRDFVRLARRLCQTANTASGSVTKYQTYNRYMG